jgi:pimeloyl-ACP methyl ester carboxylesterase
MTLLAPAILCILASGGGDPLDTLLRKHFTAKTRAEQRRHQDKILSIDGLTAKSLAEAIREVQLWEDQPPGDYEITLRLRKGKASEKKVWMHVPPDYHTDVRWPLIITMHGQGGEAEAMLRLTLKLLGRRSTEFIVASPQRIGAAKPEDSGAIGFTFPAHLAARPRTLLNALRRQYRIDSDRVYLMGYSLGAHNAWMGAVMHADCFAGVVPLATPLQLVGGELLFEEVLQNIRNTRMLFCWGAKDNVDAEGKIRLDGGNVAWNRKITAVIEALGIDGYEPVELPDAGHLDARPPLEKFNALLDRRRRRYPHRVRQVFRLAEQSPAYWVAADQLQGAPLPDGPLTIKITEGEDPDAAQRRYLIGKLGLIEARRKGQTISVTSRRTVRVVLLPSDALIDLDKPVTIRRGKKKVFSGKIERDLRVMLTEAARGWDFARLPCARVVVPIAGKVKFGYPSHKKKR